MKVLVIQGAGMDQRGKSQVEIFGPETLEQINAQILQHAKSLGIEVEIYQSNDEDEVVARLRRLETGEIDALIINPGGFTATEGTLPQTVSELAVPAFEVHASNPTARGVQSTLLPVCKGAVCGFGYAGYAMALRAISGT
jgi:3-dehydroquinate dehydratase-2